MMPLPITVNNFEGCWSYSMKHTLC